MLKQEVLSLDPLVPPDSPCVKICALDERGYCRGCLRTGAEIASWRSLSPAAQWRLVALLRERRAALSA